MSRRLPRSYGECNGCKWDRADFADATGCESHCSQDFAELAPSGGLANTISKDASGHLGMWMLGSS